MKKLYVLLLSTCLIAPVLAQPTFTSADFIQIGDAITTFPLDPTGLTEGSAGANQTWNYSAATTTGAGVTANAVSPASTPYASMYPAANLAVKTISSQGNDGYGFYNVTSGYADLVGSGVHAPTMDNFFVYSDAMRAVTFPWTYNSSNQDSYVAFMTYTANGLQVNDYRRGAISVVADAYGSLTTPDATYPNTLRLHQTESSVDSVIIAGFPTAQMVFDNRTSYTWSPANYINSAFIITYDTIDQGTGPQASVSASYSSSVTGIKESYSLKALDVYPNPAVRSSVVYINTDELNAGNTTFRAIDVNGKIVKQFDFIMYAANHKSVSVDMSDCNTGFYFIQLVQKSVTYSTKFVLN
jgi:hypothetical protein